MSRYSIFWVPSSAKPKPVTKAQALQAGGREVEKDLSALDAKQFIDCVTIGAPKDGYYITEESS